MSSSSYNPNITLTSLSTQQGEINLVTNPIAQFDASNWTTSSATLTRSTTGVLSPVIPTGFTASSTTSTTSYVQTSLLNVPATLRNRKLKVQLYIQCADTATWKVDVLKSDGSTRYTLSTDSSGVSALPALTGTYTTTFDMDTGSGIYVRLTRYAGSGTSTLSFTNLIVGPGIQPQGAAVQNSLTYTLTIGGTTTAPTPGTNTSVASYVRVGDMMKLNYSFRQTALGSAAGSGTYLFPLPTGLTIDSTRIGSFAIEGNSILGAAEINNGTTTLIGVVLPYNSTNLIIQVGNDTTAPTYVSSTFYQVNTNTNLRYSFEAMLPIAEWAGSGTVQLAQNDVEYAWNSDPGTTANTTYSNSTYYGYGPNGTSIPAIASTTTTGESKTVYTVVFQTPVQATDQVVVELNDGNGWFNAAQRFPPFTNNAASYGVLLVAINSTTYRVAFGNAGYGTSNATTYGAAGGAWSGVTSWRWRVRKSSAGAAVGFGIVSSQSAGLLPVSNSNLDDATATRLGLKQYLHGTTYNGGIAPTITLGGGGGTLSSVDLSSFIPYQTQDGTWKLKVNIVVTVSSAVRTLAALDVVGISVGTLQAIYGLSSTSPLTATSYVSSNRFQIDHSSSTTTKYYFSGEVVLSSKPTWAY